MRAPAPEEIKKHLAFDRLAKSSNLERATLLLIVDAQRPQNKPAPTIAGPIAGPARDVIVFTLALLTCIAVAVAYSSGPMPPFVTHYQRQR